jgi:hypothetical protein
MCRKRDCLSDDASSRELIFPVSSDQEKLTLPDTEAIHKLDAIPIWLTTNVRRPEAVIIKDDHQKFSGGDEDRNGRGDRI